MFFFRHCVIKEVHGIGNDDKMKKIFVDCIVGEFKAAITISRISELPIGNEFKTLLALIKKLFFQKGGGRQEGALLRGAEAYWDSAVAEMLLNYFETNGIVRKAKGDHGNIYIPRRAYTKRMARIWELQTNCRDEIWDRVSEIRQ